MSEDTNTTPSGTQPDANTQPNPPAATPEPVAPDPNAVPDAVPETGAPEKYDIKTPEGSLLDVGATERIATTARELGLSNDAAQRTVDLLSQELASNVAAQLEARQPGGAEWTKQVDAWEAEVKADVSLGKTDAEREASISSARQALDFYVKINPTEGAKLKEDLEKTGLGSYPPFVRLLAWVGKEKGEGRVLTSTPGEGKKTAAETLYPKEAAAQRG